METDKLIVLSEMSVDEKKLVQDQLKVILESTYFNSSKRKQRFLEYVVEKTLAGDGNLLKQYTIGVEALELPDDFDSDSNPVVRIMGGRVRNRLKEFNNNIKDNEFVITIPKGTYTPEFFRSSYDNEISQTSVNTEIEEIEISTGPRIALVSFTDKTQNKTSNRLILSATDAIAKELTHFVLAKFIVQNPYSDKSESSKFHQEVDTDYGVFLFIQEAQNNKYELLYRITDNKLNVLWSESYEIDPEIPLSDQKNVFAKIITTIIDTHQGKIHSYWARSLLLNKERISDKFRAVVYYRQFYDNFNVETFKEAINACDLALEKNSDDVIANILMADLCRRDYIHGYNVVEIPIAKGVEYAKRATYLQNDSHEAHFLLGQILFSQGEHSKSLEELQIARSLNQFGAVIEYASGFHYCLAGRWEEGLSLVKKAMNMSDTYPTWYHYIISLDFYRRGDYKQALTEAQKIVTPVISHGPIARCIAYAKLGELVKAQTELKEIKDRIPKLEKNGKSIFLRHLGNQKLVDDIWEGIEIAIKG